MEILQWHESFNVGVGLVDKQHEKLFSLINKLIGVTESSQESEIIAEVLNELMDYTVYHFKTEETFFKIHPDYKKHQIIHQKFVTKVSEFASVFEKGNLNGRSAIISFLIDWLKNHVLGTDKIFFQELGYSCTDKLFQTTQKNNHPLICSKILVVDDSMDQRILLKAVLEQESYTVLEAEDGLEALKICQTNPDIRIVITDINMPKMDGYELIKSLRRQQAQYTYIIVVTILDNKDSVIEALTCGADDFLSKPIFPQELHLRLQGGQQLLRLESSDELIFSMAKLSDYRSQETGLHLERVQQYTLEIGNYLANNYPEKGVSNQMANEISRMSPLHDIGKVAIVDQILTKPGRLTDEEFEIMKDHSRIGGDLISDIYLKTGSPSLRIGFEIAMYHHEKWDGSGYPAGLSGKGIPIAARIMAIADEYDALTTKRVYKDAFSHEKAKQIILEGKGKSFDPDIVDTFLALEEKFIHLKERFSDKLTL